MKNKKSQVVTGPVMIFLYLGTALLVILFFFIFKLIKSGNDVKIDQMVGHADSNYIIVNYLRSPYNFNGKETNRAELLAHYEYEKDANIKKNLYDVISLATLDILNQQEYCQTEQSKLVNGFAIIILDEDTYNSGKLWIEKGELQGKQNLIKYVVGTAVNEDKKFRSENFLEGNVEWGSAEVLAIPEFQNNVYLGIFKSKLAGGKALAGKIGC